jgi:hypothetical protein
MEALRGVGYSVASAVADLIDNCVSASARNVWLRFAWEGRHSFVSVTDDGLGMDSEEIVTALTIGSRSPLDDRVESDLGRFGLGLKTASLSQCRRLTVISHRLDRAVAAWRWDLDHVAQTDRWELLPGLADEPVDRPVMIDRMPHGTTVLWERLDRILSDTEPIDSRSQDNFLRIIDSVERHLGMVFHRYLQAPSAVLRIFVNGETDSQRIKAWDPFLRHHPATIVTPLERIPSIGSTVEVQGFVLPHREHLDQRTIVSAGGPDGWTSQQGFYVYRNRRLLVPGSWLGLGIQRPWTKEEPYRLARLRLDIPNNADAGWKLDIKKSWAQPPENIRPRLTDLAEWVRRQAERIASSRVQSPDRGAAEPLERAWLALPARSSGLIKYRINREHPVVRQALSRAPEQVGTLLRVVEETVPVQRVWVESGSDGLAEVAPFEGTEIEDLKRVLRAVFQDLVGATGLSASAARERLRSTEPFQRFPELLDEICVLEERP